MFDIAPRTGEKIVDAQDFVAIFQQFFAQMGAQETGPPVTSIRLFIMRPRGTPGLSGWSNADSI